jgi:small-conductance mechanosensitive channel
VSQTAQRSLLLLLTSLAAMPAGPARAEEASGADPSAAAGAAASPRPIPAHAVARAADELAGELRAIEQRTQADARVRAIEHALPARSQQLTARLAETRLALETGASALALEQLAEGWSPARSALEAWSETLAQDASDLEAQLGGLVATRERWQRSLAPLLDSGAPPAVVERARGALEAIAGTQRWVEERRSEALVRQDAVEHEIERCDTILGEIERAHASAARLLRRDGRTVGELLRTSLEREAVRTRVAGVLAVESSEVIAYVRGHAIASLLLAPLFVALAVAFRRSRRWARAQRERGEEPSAAELLERPYSSALLITLLATLLLYVGAPVALRSAIGAVAVIPVVRILRPTIAPALRPTLRALAGVVVLDRTRWLLAAVRDLEQGLLLVELLVCLALAVQARVQVRAASHAGSGPGAGLRRLTPGVLGAVFALSLVAAATGYVQLGREIGGETIRVLYAALVLQAGATVLKGLVGFALRVRPLARMRTVARHLAAVERRLVQGIGGAATLGTGLVALSFFGAWAPARRAASALAALDLAPGPLHVTVGEALALVATVWAAFLISRWLRVVLEDDVYPRARLARGIPYALSSLLHYVILALGFMLALTMLGVSMDRITVLLGAFGVGLGFGLQNVIGNFVAGLILLLERPVQVGDLIQLSDLVGEVHRIGIRSSTMRTLDGAEVLIPNASLISDRVTNWTLSDQLRRVDLAVGVAYGSDLEAVIDLLGKVAALHPRVCQSPPPSGLFTGFGESSLDFQLRFWTEERDWMRVRSEVGISVSKALREAGIAIPFPQREVSVRAASEG